MPFAAKVCSLFIFSFYAVGYSFPVRLPGIIFKEKESSVEGMSEIVIVTNICAPVYLLNAVFTVKTLFLGIYK